MEEKRLRFVFTQGDKLSSMCKKASTLGRVYTETGLRSNLQPGAGAQEPGERPAEPLLWFEFLASSHMPPRQFYSLIAESEEAQGQGIV